jgi:hypothetical protein
MLDLAVTTLQPLPLWTAAALLVLLLVVIIVAVRRYGVFASVGALVGVAALVVIAFSAWTFADHTILQQQTAERDALNGRALQLTAAAMAPGSPLACLDGGADEAVNAACEASIFRTPETVAAATAYVEAKLRLLADSLDYVHRADRLYYDAHVPLRGSLEADRYGVVAHVLMARHGCTAEACSAFGWLLLDVGAVKANMAARKLENEIARYAASWSGQGSLAAAAVVAPPVSPPIGATISALPGSRLIDFPSAASIPPISIMTPPADPAPAGAENGMRRAPAGATRSAPPNPPASAANPERPQ